MWKILHVSKGHRQCEHVTINRFTPLQETMRVKLQCLMTSRFFSYKDWIGCSDESGFAWWNNQHHLPFRINGSLTIALKHSDIECITLFPRGLLELVERHFIEAQFRDGHVLSKHGLEKAERHLEKWCSSKRKLCGLALRRRRGFGQFGFVSFYWRTFHCHPHCSARRRRRRPSGSGKSVASIQTPPLTSLRPFRGVLIQYYARSSALPSRIRRS